MGLSCPVCASAIGGVGCAPNAQKIRYSKDQMPFCLALLDKLRFVKESHYSMLCLAVVQSLHLAVQPLSLEFGRPMLVDLQQILALP